MSNNIIEIFLFVDPLGRRCNNVRKTVQNLREEQIDRVRLRIVPMVNSKKVFGHAQKQRKINTDCIVSENNRFATNTYKASLAFYASTMQGRKFGDKFLSALQHEVVEKDRSFSESLVFEIAEEIEGFDLEMFTEDYKSDLAKNIYRKNLNLASEMNVAKTPSCVIFKDDDESDAIRLDKKIEMKVLRSVCEPKELQNSKKDASRKNTKRTIQNIFNLNTSS